ncbi:MAG TPA: hypothetical protein VFN53_01350 [Acidobacteriaceae bacterium]|nr:hypothetical protein [Acidobacteriaceae bacterium]
MNTDRLSAENPPGNASMCRGVAALTFLGTLMFCIGAQTQSTQSPPAPHTRHSRTSSHSHASHSKKHGTATRSKPAAAIPQPAPPLPPVQQSAQQAKIQFHQGTLSINAQNSSLKEILDQVSHQTGLEIDGLDHDERIYGQYGPDTVANTLTDLLDGSGYNYVMIGGGNGAPPTKLLLTANNGGPGAGNAAPPSSPPPAANAAPSQEPPPDTQPTDDVSQHPAPTPQELLDQLRKDHPPQ